MDKAHYPVLCSRYESISGKPFMIMDGMGTIIGRIMKNEDFIRQINSYMISLTNVMEV